MPARSVAQQQAAGIALAAQRGKRPYSGLKGPAKQMARMGAGDLKKFARTKHSGLPAHKESLARTASVILDRLLSEDEDLASPEERQEVVLARNILRNLQALQSSLPDPTPEQQHALTGIRAAAHSLVRMHGAGSI